MEKKQVKNLKLNEYVVTECNDNVNISFGNNVSSIGNNSFAFNQNNTAGSTAYLVVSKDDENNKIYLNTIDALEIGMVYSMFAGTSGPESYSKYIYGNRDFVGKIISIDPTEKSITVDNVWKGVLQDKSETGNNPSYIWFPFNPILSGDYVIGTASFATGYNTQTSQFASFSSGISTVAAGKYSHAVNYGTIAGYACFAEGYETSAIGHCSHTEGQLTLSRGNTGHAEGKYTQALANITHAAGISAIAKDNYSYIWNGDYNKQVSSNGAGTFNINTIKGLSGVYINDESLATTFKNNFDYVSAYIDEKLENFKPEIDIPDIPVDNEQNAQELKRLNDVVDPTNSIYVSSSINNIELTSGGFLDSNGNINTTHPTYQYSNLISLSNIKTFIVSLKASSSVRAYALYDADQKCLGTFGKDVTYENEMIDVDYLKSLVPESSPVYIRFSCDANTNFYISTILYENTVPKLIDKIYNLNSDLYQYENYETTTFSKQYLNRANGKIEINYTQSITTDFIKIEPLNYDKFKVSGIFKWTSGALVCGYDINKNFIFSMYVAGDTEHTNENKITEFNDMIVDCDELLKTYQSLSYLRFCSFNENGKTLQIKRFTLKSTINENVLHGKKYVACGDSYSSVNGAGFIPYPNIIGERNHMNYVNAAKSSTRMCLLDNTATNIDKSFAKTIINNISSDLSSADYITFAYGINEQGSNINYGTKDDNSLSTIWGSWNTTLSSVFTWNPTAKVGIIVMDCINDNMNNCLSSIAEYWGLPILNLAKNTNIPPMTNTNRSNLNPFIKQIRKNVFATSDPDGHPNQAAHTFYSTIIENFLRSF